MDLTAAECNMQLKDLLSPPWLVSRFLFPHLLTISTSFLYFRPSLQTILIFRFLTRVAVHVIEPDVGATQRAILKGFLDRHPPSIK